MFGYEEFRIWSWHVGITVVSGHVNGLMIGILIWSRGESNKEGKNRITTAANNRGCCEVNL